MSLRVLGMVLLLRLIVAGAHLLDHRLQHGRRQRVLGAHPRRPARHYRISRPRHRLWSPEYQPGPDAAERRVRHAGEPSGNEPKGSLKSGNIIAGGPGRAVSSREELPGGSLARDQFLETRNAYLNRKLVRSALKLGFQITC